MSDETLHPLTADLVARFSAALSEKLLAAQIKYGYSDGWRSPDWMGECRGKLLEHVAKGDPRDVAAYCAFLWHHNASAATPSDSVGAPVAWRCGPWLFNSHEEAYECQTHDNSHPIEPLYAAPPAVAVTEGTSDDMVINGQPATAHSILAALVDIHDDRESAAPEHRCYIPSAYSDTLDMARKFLAVPTTGATEAPSEGGPGSPLRRYRLLMAELEARFPHPEPFSSVEPSELHYLRAIDALAAPAPALPIDKTADKHWVARADFMKLADAYRVLRDQLLAAPPPAATSACASLGDVPVIPTIGD